jgi:hypothetical protein
LDDAGQRTLLDKVTKNAGNILKFEYILFNGIHGVARKIKRWVCDER